MPSSLRMQLLAWYIFIFGSTLVCFSIFLYRDFVNNHRSEFDRALYNYAIDVASGIEIDFFGQLSIHSALFAQSEKIFPFAQGESFLQLSTLDGKVLAKSRNLGRNNLPFDRIDRQAISNHNKTVFKTVSIQPGLRSLHKSLRLVSYLIDSSIDQPLVLVVGIPMALLEGETRGLLTFFSIAIPIVLVIAGFSGLYLTRKTLAPVNAIIGKTREISARDLSERVPVPKSQDEIFELAKTLNGLLDRLEQAFRSQEHFVADASHQLKTPLAILRGEIDLIRTQPRTEEEVSNFLESASQEIRHLSRVVENLLILARMDAGAGTLRLSKIRLDELVMDLVSDLSKTANLKEVRVSPQFRFKNEKDSFEMEGDADLIRSVVYNILENAIKYSPPKSKVDVDLFASTATLELQIKDVGPGMSEDIQSKIFDRFYRGIKDSENQVKGTGLGLAIAKRIVQLHHGSIDVQSQIDHGSTFVVKFARQVYTARS